MKDESSRPAAAPWWAKRIRHGSLLQKRLTHLFTLVAAGVLWFCGDLYNLWLEYGRKVEQKIYSSWGAVVAGWFGYGSTTDEPRIFNFLSWLDLVGDIGFFLAVAWSLLWIYSDAVCITSDFSASCTPGREGKSNRKAMRIFVRNAFLASAVAVASYLVAWQALVDSRQLLWLLNPDYAADKALERLQDPSRYVPSWSDILWNSGFGKATGIAIDAVVASQHTGAPPATSVASPDGSNLVLYGLCGAVMCVASWLLLENSVRPEV